MAKELGENTSFKISIKTLLAVAVGIASAVGFYYMIMGEIQLAKELPKPGKGLYIVDPGDPSATQTWPAGRQEYKMKDQLARQTLIQLEKRIEALEEKSTYYEKEYARMMLQLGGRDQ